MEIGPSKLEAQAQEAKLCTQKIDSLWTWTKSQALKECRRDLASLMFPHMLESMFFEFFEKASTIPRASPSNKTYLHPISRAEVIARRGAWASPHNGSPAGKFF